MKTYLQCIRLSYTQEYHLPAWKVENLVIYASILDMSGSEVVHSPLSLAGVTVYLPVPARLFARQTESSARTLCSWTSPSQEGLGSCGFRGFLAGLKHWFQMYFPTYVPFHAETQTRSFICACTFYLILSVETRKPAWLSRGFAGVHTFFQVLNSPLMKQWFHQRFVSWPHSGWSSVQSSLGTHARPSSELHIRVRRWLWPTDLFSLSQRVEQCLR